MKKGGKKTNNEKYKVMKTREKQQIANNFQPCQCGAMFNRRFENRSDCEASWWLSIPKLQGPMTKYTANIFEKSGADESTLEKTADDHAADNTHKHTRQHR